MPTSPRRVRQRSMVQRPARDHVSAELDDQLALCAVRGAGMGFSEAGPHGRREDRARRNRRISLFSPGMIRTFKAGMDELAAPLCELPGGEEAAAAYPRNQYWGIWPSPRYSDVESESGRLLSACRGVGHESWRFLGESPNCDCSGGSDEFPTAATASMTVVVPQWNAMEGHRHCGYVECAEAGNNLSLRRRHMGSNQPPDDDYLHIHCIGPREGFT
jgi:hypothetical protein